MPLLAHGAAWVCCSYLLAFLPEGSGHEDVQQLMTMLDPEVLEDIQR